MRKPDEYLIKALTRLIIMKYPNFTDKTKKATAIGLQISGIFSVLLFLFVSQANSQQLKEPTSWTLTKVEATGLQRYSQDLVITESGLKVGQQVDIAMINSATERLRNSGLFAKAGYSYRYLEDQLELIFKTEEMVWNLPVIFDNFIWFSDEELMQAIAREVPTFDGLAPKSGAVINRISKVLGRLLEERKIAGQVDYTPSYEESGADKNHIFSVKGLNLSICALRFPNATSVAEGDLVKSSKSLLNSLYSKGFIVEFAKSNLIPFYRERGHLQAKFIGIQANQETSANCKNGVAMAMLFNEGAAYNLDKVEWTNHSAIAARELDTMLGLKSGEVANGLKFDNGIKAIKASYSKLGFIRAAITTTSVFEDANRLVTYRISINEGGQYRMGNLMINGLPDKEVERAQKKWKLKAGDTYDGSYINEYLKAGLDSKLALKILGVKFNTDKEKLTVDVTINFQ
jgi:outer membrane protein assembly factor BamA